VANVRVFSFRGSRRPSQVLGSAPAPPHCQRNVIVKASKKLAALVSAWRKPLPRRKASGKHLKLNVVPKQADGAGAVEPATN
jgi:hypothetical protein